MSKGSGNEQRPSEVEPEPERELIEQFYKLAVERYGIDSDQARCLRTLLEQDTERGQSQNLGGT